ncbi:MAG: hypothetical protein [Circular genetic element sp.]|nr:MAG: hypothetical protein [Circular genetic element sp.]
MAPARRNKKKGNKALKKTTKKGAYRKGAKMAMAIRRNPFVENKTRILSEIWQMNGHDMDPATGFANPTLYWPLIQGVGGSPVYSSGVFSVLPLHNYTTMFQTGRLNTEQSNRMSGTNIFAKYLNVKGKIRWPSQDDQASTPQSLQLVWGWTAPANFTTNTTPDLSALTPQQLTAHIIEQLGEYFNSPVDELQFQQKRNNNIRIAGKRWLKPRTTGQISQTASVYHDVVDGATGVGVKPDTKFSCSFKIMKKTHYDAGGQVNYAGTAEVDQAYNLNDHPIPFVVLYQPEEGNLYPGDADKRPAVAYNSALYYTDS